MGILGWGGSGHMPSLTSVRMRVLWLLVGGFPGGETWFSSLEITSSHRLLGRNIKIQLDISQVFYHAVSDPFPLITLYTHLNTDTHFWIHCSHSNVRGGKGGATFCTRWKSFGRTSSLNRGTKNSQELTRF